MKTKILTALTTVLMAGSMLAQDFEYQGVKYTVLDESAKTVTTKVGKGNPMTTGNFNFSGELVIPEKVEYNGQQYTVTAIGDFSFMNYPQYENSAADVTSLSLPNTITYIGGDAFAGNKNLKIVVIPESVTGDTESSVFRDCDGLETIVIPSGITRFGSYYFSPSRNLKEVICYAQTPPYATPGVFTNTGTSTENVTLYVPAGSEQAYADYKWSQTSSNPYGAWHYFGTIKSIDEWKGLGGGGVEPEQPGEPQVFETPDNLFFDIDEVHNLSVYLSNGSAIQTLAANDVQWASSDDSIVSVNNNGEATGVAYGNATITATNAEGTLLSVNAYVGTTLSVVYPNGSKVDHHVPYNAKAVVDINPSERWRITSASHDGADITEFVVNNGTYVSAEPITGNSVITLVAEEYDNPTVGVENVEAANIRLLVNGRTLTVVGAEPTDIVSVYNIAGASIYQGVDKTFTLDNGGVYLVRVAGKTYKLAIL